MIWHDRIEVWASGMDENNDPIPPTRVGVLPAEVQPVSSTEILTRTGQVVTAYYRVLCGKTPTQITPTTGSLRWRGRTLTVHGEIEPHYRRGRLHHWEFLAKPE